MRRRLQRLVVLALLQLAVADHDDDAPAPAEVPLRPGDAAALRDAHAERAGVRLDARHADVRMAVEPAEPAQPQQLLRRDDAERVEDRVQARHVVALRREVHVAVGVVEAELGDVQLLVEQEDDDVHRAEARAEVAGAGALDGGQRVEPAHVGDHGEARFPRAGELRLRDEAQLAQGVSRRWAVTAGASPVASASSSVFSQISSTCSDSGR